MNGEAINIHSPVCVSGVAFALFYLFACLTLRRLSNTTRNLNLYISATLLLSEYTSSFHKFHIVQNMAPPLYPEDEAFVSELQAVLDKHIHVSDESEAAAVRGLREGLKSAFAKLLIEIKKRRQTIVETEETNKFLRDTASELRVSLYQTTLY